MLDRGTTSAPQPRRGAAAPAQRPGLPAAPAFTIVELLVVIAMIIVLLSLLTVVIGSATRTSQSTQTTALMSAIKQALARFREDVGYLPPVLSADPTRALVPPPDPASGTYAALIQDWHSATTLPEYLLGYGEGAEDGYGYVDVGERPPLGIRHPGPDGVWGATRAGGLLADRSPPIDGRRYGPYLELKDQRLLASTNGTVDANGNLQAFIPGESGYSASAPKVLVDYWGRPIRYYRRVYATGSLGTFYRPYDSSIATPTLADLFLLRPFEPDPGEAINGMPDLNPDIPGGDPTTTRSLKAAEFALFSPGPDRFFHRDVRYDASGFNRDNIVELGP